MLSQEVASESAQSANKTSATDLLEEIRASHVEGRICQMRQLDRIESACLMAAGGALGTMAAVGIGSNNGFLVICGAGAFVVGLVAGIQGLYQHLWPPIQKDVRRLKEVAANRTCTAPKR